MNPAAFAARQKNARKILDYLIHHGETSRVALSGALGISSATVTHIVAELMEKGLVFEGRQEQSAVGRKSTLLQFHGDLHRILTAEITGAGTVHFQISNLLGQVVSRETVCCDLAVTESRSQNQVLAELVEIFRLYLERQPPEIARSICMAGVCVYGMVNDRQTVDMTVLNWKGMNLVAPLQAALRMPVCAEGVTRIRALYELRYMDPAEKNVLYLNLTDGVGMVHFHDGNMVTGKNGIAGEVGHISLDIHGPRCYCGNRGCFEHFCGPRYILGRAKTMVEQAPADDVLAEMAKAEPLTMELLFRGRKAGSLTAHELLSEVSEYLGAGIAALYNIFDPDQLIVSVYMDEVDSYLMDRAVMEARGRILNRFSREVSISPAHLTGEALHLAISAFVLSKFLDTMY